MRHLLAKLLPSITKAIIKFYNILKTRFKLVVLASRIEAADSRKRRTLATGAESHKATEQNAKRLKRKRDAKGSQSKTLEDTNSNKNKGSGRLHKRDVSELTCYHCDKKGHIRPNCPDLRDGDTKAVRKVGAGDSESKKGKQSGKERSPAENRS